MFILPPPALVPVVVASPAPVPSRTEPQESTHWEIYVAPVDAPATIRPGAKHDRGRFTADDRGMRAARFA